MSLYVLFFRLGARTIELWDESRVANNALEMAFSGLSLVTTYQWVPDHWNTKPPLLIWLMAGSIKALGPNELAVRLPSAMAGCMTAVLLFWFCARRLGSAFLGFLAVALLLCTPGYIHYHAARSGDYDALMTLFMVAYLLAGYLYINSERPVRLKWLVVCGAFILLAFMTKVVQGLIFVAPLLLYALAQRKLVEVLKHPWFYVTILGVVAVSALYYVLREGADPGYMQATLANDFGRFSSTLEGHRKPFFWYVANVGKWPWLITGWLAGLYLVWKAEGEHRRVAVCMLITSVFYTLIISLSATKLAWYAMPVAPISALLTGMGVFQGFRSLASGRGVTYFGPIGRGAIISLVVGLVCLLNAMLAINRERHVAAEQLTNYGRFLRLPGVAIASSNRVLVVQPGYDNATGAAFYAAPTLFYATALRSLKKDFKVHPADIALPDDVSEAVVCDGTKAVLAGLATDILFAADGCGLYRVVRREAR